MEDEGFRLQDVAGVIRRRASLVGLTFLGTVLASLVAAYSLENLFKSTGVIIIEQREVSATYLPGTYQGANPEQRIARIYDEVMTRENLAEIIERHNLYAEKRSDGSPESVVSELRKDFELDFLMEEDDPRSKYSGEVTGFTLSYYNADPQMARAVARDVVDLFQEGNRKRRQAAYIETAAALERESDTLRDQVSELEGQLSLFKSEHPGALPEDRNYNRQVIDRKAGDLDSLDREIRSLQDRKTMLQSQLAQTELWMTAIGPAGETLPTSSERLRNLQGEYLQLLGNYNPDHPDLLRLKREIESLSGGSVNPAFRQAVEFELNSKRTELADSKRNYGPNHPDIRNLERAISALENQLAGMRVESSNLPPPNNPVYLNLELQISSADNELVALRRDRTALQQETRDLDRKVLVAPEVERRYLELTRDLELARQQYKDSKSRLMSVQRAGVLEEEELAERYVVTRYPGLPFQPAFPNRLLFVVIGIFMGLTFGLGAGIIAEALDSSIRSTRDIKAILGMPPISVIPEVRTESDLGSIRTSRLAYATGICTAVVAVAIYVHLQRIGAV